MARALLVLGVVMGVSALSSMAAAQSASGGGSLGPETLLQGRPSRQVNIDLTASVAHDSNISRASPAVAAQRNITPADWTYSPSGAVSIVQPLGQQAVFLDGVAGYRFHQKNKRLDRAYFSGSTGAAAALGPCGGLAGGGYSQSSSDVETEVVDAFVENLRKTRRINLDVVCAHQSGFGIVVSGAQEWVKSDLQQTRISDNDTSTLTVGLTYQRPEAGAISIFGAYSRTMYPNRITVDASQSGMETRSIGATATRQLGGRIEATVSGGYTQVENVGGRPIGAVTTGPSDFSGLTYAGGVTYRASSRLRGEVNFERQVAPSFVSVGSFQVRTSYSGAVTYKLGSRLTFEVAGQHKDSDIRGIGVASAASTLTNSLTKVISGSLTYKQSKRLSWAVDVDRTTRSSDNPLFNYNNHGVVLSLVVSL